MYLFGIEIKKLLALKKIESFIKVHLKSLQSRFKVLQKSSKHFMAGSNVYTWLINTVLKPRAPPLNLKTFKITALDIEGCK
jgi:hypothetical protein